MTPAGGRAATKGEIPRHVAIIMDGNGRWAARRKWATAKGHRAGAENAREILRRCRSLGVEVLTLFAFSSENWRRSKREVEALLGLLAFYLDEEIDTLDEEGVCVRFIGSRERFGAKLRRQMDDAERRTGRHRRYTLVVALDYGGRRDIVEAAKTLAARAAAGECRVEDIDEAMFADALSTAAWGDPDLCIRTGGEHRLSNFLLWQSAYTELHVSDALWPDFDADCLERALRDYGQRQRRFGARVRGSK